MKVCSRCKQELELENFGKQSRYPDGLRKWCKKCESQYYQQTKNNPSIRESKRKADKKYNITHKEYRNRKSREWHILNKERANKDSNRWYTDNRDYVLNIYVKINLDRYRLHSAIRRALKVSISDGTVTKDFTEALYMNQEFKCAICGCELESLSSSKRNLDHIYPISKGGVHSIYNLQWTCQRCNFSKGAKIAN